MFDIAIVACIIDATMNWKTTPATHSHMLGTYVDPRFSLAIYPS